MIYILSDDVWSYAMLVIINYFMKIMDWMWSLKLPATDIPLYVLWILGGIFGVIFRVLGSSPQLSTMSQNTKGAFKTMAPHVNNMAQKSAHKVKNVVNTHKSNKSQTPKEDING